jgi:hypothetical protein
MLDGNWRHFVRMVPRMSENEVRDALRYERKTENRTAYVERLHRKYNRLRYRRERIEMGLENESKHLGRSSRK